MVLFRKLVSISEYAEYYELSRNTVYSLIEKGLLKKHSDKDGNPLIDRSQRPTGVQKYLGKRERMKR